MNFHFRPPRFKDPPPSSPHSGFHPLFSAVFTRGRRVVAPWHLLLSFDPSTRPSNPSFSSNPSLPSASPSFFLVFSLSNFFAFFHFLRFLSVDKAKRHFPSFVSFSSFFFFSFIIRVFGFLFRLQVFPPIVSFRRLREGDVFHRGCIALWSCFEVSGCLNWTQVSRFKEFLGKNNIPNETSNIWYK